jgi:diguanylate cyclase (GGDEF)-like protein/PAS domain S-box-containing protein
VLRSIRSRLLALVVATVVPFSILIGAGVWSQWRNDQAAAIQQTIDEARLLAARVDDHIGNLQNLLIGLSRAVSTDPLDTDANDALLRKAKDEQPDFVGQIELLALDGTDIGSTYAPGPVRRNGSYQGYFKKVLGGETLAIGDLFRSRNSQRWIVTVARPVEDRAGRLGGVLVVGTWLEQFQDALRARGLPPGSIVSIINNDGIIIARTVDAAKWIGHNVSNPGRIKAHLEQREGSEIAAWSDGVERVTGFSMVHRAPWQVIVGVPTETAFAAVANRLGWSSLCILGALVIGFGIAWTFSGHVVRPLRQLGRDAARLASGELSHRSQVKTQGEIGALADDFNRMAGALERRAQEANGAADEVRQAKETLAAVIDASPVAIVCCDINRDTVLWNRSAEDMFGYSAEEMIGRPTNLGRPSDGPESQVLFERALKGETYRNVEIKRLRKDGSLLHVRVAAAPLYNLDGTVRGVARTYLDVTESKRAEEQLRRLAHYDPLTGLPNRLSLQKELGRLLAGSGHRPVAVALFDLDGFKDINDTLGHSTGDQLLIEVCHRFLEIADGLDRPARVYRLGGDEFVVIVSDCGDPRVIAEIVDAILKRLAAPFDINGNILHVGSSAGIAIAPNDADQADDLIANADLALYQAKADGGKAYRFFLPALRARAQARRGLGIELRRAFAQGELELYYQAQVRLADQATIGAEALLRWRHPERGLIAPAAFIDALAESSIATEVGAWIIRSACEAAARWRGLGLHLDRIAVNLFPAQAQSAALITDVEAALRTAGLPPDCLEIEITENAALT